MKFLNQSNLDIKKSDDIEGLDCGIDASNLGFMFEVVSSQMYKNAIGSIVREITSNCFDSHIEAGVVDAVVLKIDSDDNGQYISFIDVGVGISPDRMAKIYSKYFSSTKRDTNGQIGMWGLGSKSPLAYTDAFQLITRFNGVEYQYVVHKGEKVPRVELLIDLPTDQRNGTEVKIYIKNPKVSWQADTDYTRFLKEIKRQLCYFDNIYFNNCGMDNNYKIYEGDNFLYRNKDQYSTDLHIVLGKVAYPIDWQDLGMSRIEFPVGLKFSIGELAITPNRESIKYTPETINTIKQRIKDLRTEITTMYNKEISETDDLFLFMEMRNTEKKIYLDENDKTVYLKPKAIVEEGLNTLLFTPMKGKYIPPNDQIFFDYKIVQKIENGKISWHTADLATRLLTRSHLYRVNGDTDPKKNKYIQIGLCGGQSVYIVKSNTKHLHSYKTYLNLFKVPKAEWRDRIKEYQEITLNALLARSKSYDRTEFDKNWWKDYRAGLKDPNYIDPRLLRKINQSLHVQIFSERSAVFHKGELKLYTEYAKGANGKILKESTGATHPLRKQIHKLGLDHYPGIIIYGGQDDKDKLTEIGKMMLCSNSFRSMHGHNARFNEKAIKIIIIARANEKYLKDNERAIRCDKFMELEFKTIRKIVTAWKLEAIMDQVLIPYDIREILKHLSRDMVSKFEHVEVYIKANGGKDIDHDNQVNSMFKKEVMMLAEEKNLFDKDILKEGEEILEYFSNLQLLRFIDGNLEAVPYIAEFMKLKKKRLNSEYYLIPKAHEVELLQEAEDKKEYLELIDKLEDNDEN